MMEMGMELDENCNGLNYGDRIFMIAGYINPLRLILLLNWIIAIPLEGVPILTSKRIEGMSIPMGTFGFSEKNQMRRSRFLGLLSLWIAI